PSVRTLILARLDPLSSVARQLVQVVAVLATAASAQRLWQLAELSVQAGVEALEEAVTRGILREEEAGVGRLGRYGFAHDLIREVVYTELGAARRSWPSNKPTTSHRCKCCWRTPGAWQRPVPISRRWRKRSGTGPRSSASCGTIPRVAYRMESRRSPWHEPYTTRNWREDVSSP